MGKAWQRGRFHRDVRAPRGRGQSVQFARSSHNGGTITACVTPAASLSCSSSVPQRYRPVRLMTGRPRPFRCVGSPNVNLRVNDEQGVTPVIVGTNSGAP